MAVLRLGAMLRDRRGRLGIREASKGIGISPATLVRVEAGRMPDLETFQKICAWLRVNPAEILDIPTDVDSSAGSANSSPVVAVHLRADKTLPPEAASDIAALIVVAHQELMRRTRQRRANVPPGL